MRTKQLDGRVSVGITDGKVAISFFDDGTLARYLCEPLDALELAHLIFTQALVARPRNPDYAALPSVLDTFHYLRNVEDCADALLLAMHDPDLVDEAFGKLRAAVNKSLASRGQASECGRQERIEQLERFIRGNDLEVPEETS